MFWIIASWPMRKLTWFFFYGFLFCCSLGACFVESFLDPVENTAAVVYSTVRMVTMVAGECNRNIEPVGKRVDLFSVAHEFIKYNIAYLSMGDIRFERWYNIDTHKYKNRMHLKNGSGWSRSECCSSLYGCCVLDVELDAFVDGRCRLSSLEEAFIPCSEKKNAVKRTHHPNGTHKALLIICKNQLTVKRRK